MDKINLLFSIDDHFVNQLKTLLYSIKINSPDCYLHAFILQKKLHRQAEIQDFCQKIKIACTILTLKKDKFHHAPQTKRYPETIYYRLLAQNYLPAEVKKVIYLDADILCVNNIQSLYQTDISDYLYAAASHSQLTNFTNVVNKVRLKMYEAEEYYNSGVLLINVPQAQKEITVNDLQKFIVENRNNLILPDQDILNSLYGGRIYSIPDQIYNYDARKSLVYEMISGGSWDLNWVIEHTVFLHFCGRDKPWKKDYRSKFALLYKHYSHLAAKI
ncbi:MAG: glycosyltransferase family 8 protein [Liquorilactobacillus nagelii]|jgi:lipopolysaccharide biosynthesis glycosyltransferase|uniref:glycosyltransferase family 8 protein n=1 Tax=Liquorilactobacillus nagelii TaxID=82688 RepID=UPI00242B71A9|nr:glycosyltransferase family 8 protein [Liquorilactobacillus nagelii]MCI1920720.1 glycosyltransferase family 8 protein [Liquorilactobacillus nagelii]MCI1977618.1 glycosyltransferase family 8 protein [Liquorilactobacillus nagelii]